jgi:hypothetical protein
MLKYYADEEEVFRQEREMKISDAEAVSIYEKLAGKYKLPQKLEFYGNRQSGACSPYRIRLSHNPSIAIISHEVAHAIQYKKFKKKYGYINGNPNLKRKRIRWHTKKHSRIMRKVCDYIDKNIDQWRLQRQERQRRKMAKFYARIEIQQQRQEDKKKSEFKLIKIRELIKKWDSKRERAENRLKKLQKREKYILNSFKMEV